jgi:hypothetical protein
MIIFVSESQSQNMIILGGSLLQYSTAQHSTAQHSTAQYSECVKCSVLECVKCSIPWFISGNCLQGAIIQDF